MPFTIQEKTSFYSPGFCVKYITGWDDRFKADKPNYGGHLKFYNGTPLYLVSVEILADRNRLSFEDILIYTGEHNAPDVLDRINKNKNEIYEMCKMCPTGQLVIDVLKLKTVEPSDFNELLPKHGLNTFFRFSNVPSPYPYYCLINPSKNTKDREFYSWFISYIYSTIVCLAPRNKVSNFSKKFLQSISILLSTRGNKNAIHLTDAPNVLDCGLGDNGEFLLPIPGNRTKKLEHFIERSIEQMSDSKHKKGKNK